MRYDKASILLTNKVSSLPGPVRQAIASIDAVAEIAIIGDRFDLLISEIGDIYEETGKVIDGETRAEQFVSAIKDRLSDENKEKAADIANAINSSVLLPIKTAFEKISMEKSSAPTTNVSTGEAPGGENLDKNQILGEIENPTPANVLDHGSWSAKQREAQALNDKYPAPANLPTGGPGPRKVPIVRTMRSDMEVASKDRDFSRVSSEPTGGIDKKTAERQDDISSIKPTIKPVGVTPNPIFRGKFGHGTPPQLNSNTATPPKPPATVPVEQKNPAIKTPTPFTPPKTNTIGNSLNDSLTKTVNIPKQTTKYNVDPYREPAE